MKISWLKILSTSFVFIGIIIGAGFASGRELLVYFQNDMKYIAFCGLMILGCFYFMGKFFLDYGNKIKVDNIAELVKTDNKWLSKTLLVVIIFCYFTSASTMVAGVDELCFSVFKNKLPLVTIATIIVAVLCVIKGISGLKIVNSILIPIILVFILTVSMITIKAENGISVAFTGNTLYNVVFDGIMYSAMNLLVASLVLAKLGGELNKREIKISSGISAVLIAVVAVLFLLAMATDELMKFAPMPLVYLATNISELFKYFSIGMIFLGIFTTLLACYFALIEWTNSHTKNVWLSAVLVVLSTYLFSKIGFLKIVAVFYPIHSFVGIIVLVVCYKKLSFVSYAEFFKKRYAIVDKSRKD